MTDIKREFQLSVEKDLRHLVKLYKYIISQYDKHNHGFTLSGPNVAALLGVDTDDAYRYIGWFMYMGHIDRQLVTTSNGKGFYSYWLVSHD